MTTLLDTPCREVQTGRTKGGYGRITIDGERVYLHRHVWEAVNGPLPEGVEVMHRCDNPPCFRYDHLVVGTHGDNLRDMFSKGRSKRQREPQTHCKRGHELSGDNVYLWNGHRGCRTCRRERS